MGYYRGDEKLLKGDVMLEIGLLLFLLFLKEEQRVKVLKKMVEPVNKIYFYFYNNYMWKMRTREILKQKYGIEVI